MIKRRLARPGFLFLAALLGLAASCKVSGKPQPFTAIGPEAATLREAFNAGVGKVRLVVLVAPT